MINHSLEVIAIDDHEAITVMSVKDILNVGVPARNFLPDARLKPLEQHEVDRLRDYHELIQRDFSGAKKSNAQGPLADYIRDQWMQDSNGSPRPGFLGTFILFFPDALPIVDGTAVVDQKGIFLDGESRGDSLLTNVERLLPDEVDRLLGRRVAVHLVHGIQDHKVVAKYFADVNGKAVKVNPNLIAMADFTDAYGETAKAVFDSLGFQLETRKRQVAAKSPALMTGLQARSMVAAVAKGVGVVQYGAKQIPTEDVDFEKLGKVAQEWVGEVFARFPREMYRDKTRVLRSVPVTASLGALGKAFYDEDIAAQQQALAVLSDKKIDWRVGEHWSGVAGKVNPATDKFAVGGAKEYAHATLKALSSPTSAVGRQIRGDRK